jgi:hypothetical protein
MESFSLRAGQEILNIAYLEVRVSSPAKPSASPELVRGGLGLDDSRADYYAIPGRNIGQALRLSSRPRQCLSIFIICIALAMGVQARAVYADLERGGKTGAGLHGSAHDPAPVNRQGQLYAGKLRSLHAAGVFQELRDKPANHKTSDPARTATDVPSIQPVDPAYFCAGDRS